MIRINLNPFKEKKLVQWGQRQVLLYVAAVLISVLVCLLWYQRRPDPEAKKKKLVAQRVKLERQTQEVQARVTCDQNRWRVRIKKARRKYRAVEKLITQRSTPKYVLRELSRILSESWGPTVKTRLAAQDKRTLYNQNWDPTTVWLTKFEEKGRQVIIEGGAKGSDDVAEFWRRLQVSAYFHNVKLEKMSQKSDSSGLAAKKGVFLQFSIKAGANY